MQFFSVRSIDEIDFNKLMQALPNRAVWNPLSTQGVDDRSKGKR